jgi:hypothetical protein
MQVSSLAPWQAYPASWTSYTPTLSCSSGALTTASATGQYQTVGKTVNIEADITITTGGTCGGLIFSLPVNAASTKYVIGGRETAATGEALEAAVLSGDATMQVYSYINGNVAGSGFELVLTGVYQSQ